MKQTAVQWLANVYNTQARILPAQLEQALAMEKEQIMDAFQNGKWDWDKHIKEGLESTDCSEYYNETYNTK